LTQFLKQKQPLTDGVLDAGDVAGAALFLLSDDARSVTGEVFRVDGGWSISGA
jgi:enoyl-[acyl-carrier-protein] reductase (NADH)